MRGGGSLECPGLRWRCVRSALVYAGAASAGAPLRCPYSAPRSCTSGCVGFSVPTVFVLSASPRGGRHPPRGRQYVGPPVGGSHRARKYMKMPSLYALYKGAGMLNSTSPTTLALSKCQPSSGHLSGGYGTVVGSRARGRSRDARPGVSSFLLVTCHLFAFANANGGRS